jgi:hypothetical protein
LRPDLTRLSQEPQELPWGDDMDALVGAEVQKVLVARNDVGCAGLQGSTEDVIIIRVIPDHPHEPRTRGEDCQRRKIVKEGAHFLLGHPLVLLHLGS